MIFTIDNSEAQLTFFRVDLDEEVGKYRRKLDLAAFGGASSGFLKCEACSRLYGCSEGIAPFFVTDLASSNGTFIEGTLPTKMTPISR